MRQSEAPNTERRVVPASRGHLDRARVPADVPAVGNTGERRSPRKGHEDLAPAGSPRAGQPSRSPPFGGSKANCQRPFRFSHCARWKSGRGCRAVEWCRRGKSTARRRRRAPGPGDHALNATSASLARSRLRAAWPPCSTYRTCAISCPAAANRSSTGSHSRSGRARPSRCSDAAVRARPRR